MPSGSAHQSAAAVGLVWDSSRLAATTRGKASLTPAANAARHTGAYPAAAWRIGAFFGGTVRNVMQAGQSLLGSVS